MSRQATLNVRRNSPAVSVREGSEILVVLQGELLAAPLGSDLREARESERARQAIFHQNGGEMCQGLDRTTVLRLKKACGQGIRKARRRHGPQRRRA